MTLINKHYEYRWDNLWKCFVRREIRDGEQLRRGIYASRDLRARSLSMSEPARLDAAYRPSEYIFVMTSIGEELCANMRPGSNDGRKQIGMFLAARARGLSSALSRASIINQRILASGRRIRCDAHVDRTYETEINAVPGRCITNTLRAPQYTAFSPDMTRSIKPQVEE